MIKALRNLGQALADNVVGHVGDAAHHVMSVVPDVNSDLITEKIEKLAEQMQPITIAVRCVPNGDGVDDYALEIDRQALDEAFSSRWVYQQIKISAISDDLDRDILAERLAEAFEPVLTEHQNQIDQIVKSKKERIREEDSMFWDNVFETVFIVVITGGLALGPIIWLWVSMAGIGALLQMPGLIINFIKSKLGVKTFSCSEDRQIDAIRSKKAQEWKKFQAWYRVLK